MTREQLIKHWDVIKAFKEGKEIQCREIGSENWFDEISENGFGFYEDYEYRIKPTPLKRLPTIEEVEKWFLENKVFRLKSGTGIVRMNGVVLKYNKIGIGESIISIDKFCEDFTHYDGSELYITENENPKLTYGGEIADFPIEVVERMLECQVEQGNKRNVSIFERNKIAGNYSKGFCWDETKEGARFWVEVIAYKNFDTFFQKYPKKQ